MTQTPSAAGSDLVGAIHAEFWRGAHALCDDVHGLRLIFELTQLKDRSALVTVSVMTSIN